MKPIPNKAVILEIEAHVSATAHLDAGFESGLRVASRNGVPLDLRAYPLCILAEREPAFLRESPGWSGLSGMTWFNRPFPFAVGTNALQQSDEVLNWLEQNDRWKRHDGGFYTSDVISVEALEPPAQVATLFDAEGRADLERAANQVFGEDLILHGPVAAHRMTAPQGIGVHSDAPVPGEETHRIVLLLGIGWTRRQGGHFLLLRRESLLSAKTIIPHAHNTAIAFRLTARSFHAITTVTSGYRFSLVVSFRPRSRSKK